MTNSKIKNAGRFYASVIRDGKVIYKDEIGATNTVVNEGLNHMLATEFAQGTVIPTWYIAPFTNDYVVLSTDTAASIVANAGETSAYDEANRVDWVEVADQPNVKMTNTASQATFTINSGITAYGAFLISTNTKGSATGTLMAGTKFTGGARALVAADQLVVTYEISATSA